MSLPINRHFNCMHKCQKDSWLADCVDHGKYTADCRLLRGIVNGSIHQTVPIFREGDKPPAKPAPDEAVKLLFAAMRQFKRIEALGTYVDTELLARIEAFLKERA